MNPITIVESLTASQSPTEINAASAQWWPELHLKKGNKLQPITPEQCAVVREIYNAGRGSSEIRKDVYLYDCERTKIGYVSYNGRVWLHDIEGDIEVPQIGVKTAAEHRANNWADFVKVP